MKTGRTAQKSTSPIEMESIPNELVKLIAAEAVRRGLVDVSIEDLTAEKLAAALLSDREIRKSYVRMLFGERPRTPGKARRRKGAGAG